MASSGVSRGSLPQVASSLSDFEIEELREAFSVFDKDDSGSITAEELGLILKSITPSVVSNISDDDLTRLVQKFDRNGDGTIDFGEFLEMMCQAERGGEEQEDELRAAFAIFDKDGDNTITAKELMGIMSALGEDVDLDTCKLMIQSVDLDGNGTIDFEEFRKMMRDGVELDAKIGATNKD